MQERDEPLVWLFGWDTPKIAAEAMIFLGMGVAAARIWILRHRRPGAGAAAGGAAAGGLLLVCWCAGAVRSSLRMG